MEVVVARAWGELIRALDSDDWRRRAWAADKIMSSWLARDHPLAPARRGMSASVSELRTISFRWQNSDGSDDEPATELLERDGQTFTVPKYGEGSDDPIGELATPPALIAHEAPSPEPPTAAPIP